MSAKQCSKPLWCISAGNAAARFDPQAHRLRVQSTVYTHRTYICRAVQHLVKADVVCVRCGTC